MIQRLLCGAVFGACAIYAQGWTELSNTALRVDNTTSVCPENNFQPPGGGMPAYNFRDFCKGIIDDWSSAAVDTKRNRMIMWGGGHVSYRGNEVYSLDLETATSGYKAQSASGVPSLRRMTDPSIYNSGCSDNPDGTPESMHTFGSFVYLPKADKMMISWLGSDYCGNADNRTWLLRMTDFGWENAAPSGAGFSSPSGGFCTLDPTQDQESVICVASNNDWGRYNVEANTWTRLIAYGTNIIQNAPSLIVDPDRKILFAIGSNYDNPATGKIYAIDLTSSSYTMTNWTSTVTGCDDLINYPYPSVTWDPALNRIVGYVPRASGSTASANKVVIFDPSTRTCVNQPITGGPTASSSILNGGGTPHGMFGRFAYVPGLGKYVVINNAAGNAWTFTLNKTAVHGLGESTLTCIDKDGDGYGTGPGCTGADADDLDDEVNTSATALSKWTDIPTYLKHLGYNPTNIYYLSTSGTNAGSPPNCKNNPAAPCLNYGYISTSILAGDAVVMRGGSWTSTISPLDGSQGSPVLFIAWPGELPHLSGASGYIDLVNNRYITIDGFKSSGKVGSASGGFSGGGWDGTSGNTANLLGRNIILRHVETTNNKWGIVASEPLEWTLEDVVAHNNPTEHGVYLASHYTMDARHCFLRRALLYDNSYNGVQFNGIFTNAVMDQIIAYDNDIAGFSWETGVNHSRLTNSIAFNNSRAGLQIYNYPGYCGVYDIPGAGTTCPYPQNYNLVENFSFYGTGKDVAGVESIVTQRAVYILNDSTVQGDMGHNTFRNIVAISPGTSTFYHPLTWADNGSTTWAAGYAATSTVQGLVASQVGGSGSTVAGIANGAFGQVGKTCVQLIAATTNSSDCTYADPLFVAASPTYWNSPESYDLRLQATSPALNAGVTKGNSPVFDLLGAMYFSSRSMGAYEADSEGSGPSTIGSTLTGIFSGGSIR